ncbi:MAG: hypothetical protein H0Z28_08125 [Archaeoglobus sp.]|nr:hypothetical protein [Archaeoglobus sp.]
MNDNGEKNAEKEIKEQIKSVLKEQFGVEMTDLAYLNFKEMGKKRIYAYTNCEGLILRKVSQGIYFGTIEKDGLRLSIEGSFLVGPKARKNVVEVSKQEAEEWMGGNDLKIGLSEEVGKYVIIKSGSYFLGCGKVKGNRIINFVPKNRRIL